MYSPDKKPGLWKVCRISQNRVNKKHRPLGLMDENDLTLNLMRNRSHYTFLWVVMDTSTLLTVSERGF